MGVGQPGSALRAAWEMANRKSVVFLEVEQFPQDDGRPWPDATNDHQDRYLTFEPCFLLILVILALGVLF